MTVVAFSGRMASGKSKLARRFAEDKRCLLVSFGAFVRAECKRREITPTRGSLQDVGFDLFRALGAETLLSEALACTGANEFPDIVLDGVRHADMLLAIRRRWPSAVLVYADASASLRYQRFCQREEDKTTSFDDFCRLDEHPIERGVTVLKSEADVVVDMSTDFDAVYRDLLSAIG